MQLDCLEYFRKIAEMKSISKVANSCHISQSALSQQMQKLEEDLGFQLLNRSNRGVELTDEGLVVLKYTDSIIRTFSKMMEELDNLKNNRQEIKIEAAWTIATYCLPCALYRMKELYPYHCYNLISKSSNMIGQDVLNDICEIGFTTAKPEENSLYYRKVIDERVVFVVQSDYDILDKIRLEEIVNYPLIILKGECIIKENLGRFLEDISLGFKDLNVIFELESTEAVKSLVLKSYGAAFVPYTAVKKEISTGELKKIEIGDINLDYNIFLVSKAENKVNGSVKDFIDGFKKLGNNICC